MKNDRQLGNWNKLSETFKNQIIARLIFATSTGIPIISASGLTLIIGGSAATAVTLPMLPMLKDSMFKEPLYPNKDGVIDGDIYPIDSMRDAWNDAESAQETPPRHYDPLVLDLNRDGKINLDNATFFDLNASGFHEYTRWISETDAFLVLDVNGNGKIDNGSEMYAMTSLMSAGMGDEIVYSQYGLAQSTAELNSGIDMNSGDQLAVDIAIAELQMESDIPMVCGDCGVNVSESHNCFIFASSESSTLEPRRNVAYSHRT